MKKIFFFTLFIFISCNSDLSIEKKFEVTYDFHIKENNEYNEILKENIKIKISKLKSSETLWKIKLCDSLSREHFDYLATIEKEVKEQGNEIFFNGDLYSQKGETYTKKNEKYRAEIEKLTSSSNFIKRLNLVFSIKDVKYKGLYVHNLDYFFKGFPKIQSSAFINDKKRRVLEFENELISEIIILDK